MDTSPASDLHALARQALPRVVGNPYVPVMPHPRQAVALMCQDRELLYGGAAGGGKSWYVLMDALQYVDIPGYAALVLRKTYTDLSQPGCLIPVSHEWLHNTDAHWNGTEAQWTFPSGARIAFGYLQSENDKYRYQGAQFQRVYFDELTQHRENDYRYLFSRQRRISQGPLSTVPIGMRSTSNPGGVGHEWVKRDFVDFPYNPDTGESRVFVRSRLEDNPSLDIREYEVALRRLDPITWRQLRVGDWSARHGGSIFRREWFKIVERTPEPKVVVRAWDLAASTGADAKRTAGVRLAKGVDGRFYVEHVVAGRWTPGERDQVILQTAQADGRRVTVVPEQEPGSGGIAQVEAITRMLRGFTVRPFKPEGQAGRGLRPSGQGKFVRAGPVASAAEIGDVCLVSGDWDIAGFLDELEAADPAQPVGDQYLDRMDALSAAWQALVPLPALGTLPPWRPQHTERVTDGMIPGQALPRSHRGWDW